MHFYSLEMYICRPVFSGYTIPKRDLYYSQNTTGEPQVFPWFFHEAEIFETHSHFSGLQRLLFLKNVSALLTILQEVPFLFVFVCHPCALSNINFKHIVDLVGFWFEPGGQERFNVKGVLIVRIGGVLEQAHPGSSILCHIIK